MNLTFAIIVYASAMTVANLTVAAFGPWVSPINAFFLIGMDLALRDWLHVRLSPAKMLCLIAAAGGLTYALNPSASHIVIASASAFTAAALVDWAAFASLKGSWLKRANGSNIAGAAVDSVVFPLMAFKSIMPEIMLMQFVAKVAGGAIWSVVLNRKDQSHAQAV